MNQYYCCRNFNSIYYSLFRSIAAALLSKYLHLKPQWNMKVSWFLHLVEHWPQRVTNNLLSKLFKGIFLLLSFLVINYRRNLFSHLVRFLGKFFTNNIQDFLSLNNSSCSSNFTFCFTSLSSSLSCWTTSLAMQSLLVFTTANTNICCPTFHIFRSLQAHGQDLFLKLLTAYLSTCFLELLTSMTTYATQERY